MSSENIELNLNNLEQVQEQKIGVIPPKEKCDLHKSSVEYGNTDLTGKENTEIFSDGLIVGLESSDSGHLMVVNPPGGNCDKHESVEDSNTDLAEKENTEILTDDLSVRCDKVNSDCPSSEDLTVNPINNSNNQNLNIVSTTILDNIEADSTTSDTSTIKIENGVGNVTSEELVKLVNCNVLDNCDSSDIKQPKSPGETKNVPEKLIRDTLIHRIKEMSITGGVKQNSQNNANKSAVILNKETDSLKNLLIYDNSSDDDNDEDDFEKNWQLHAIPDSGSDSESDSESMESSDDDDDDDDDDIDDVNSSVIFGEKDKGAIKKDTSKVGNPSKSLLDVLDPQELSTPLPDLSKLKINVENEDFLHIGNIQAIIDTLVTVEASPGTPAYDLDSYLFVEDKTTKKPLGPIYDVIGPVTAPIYCIRFNSSKDIQDLNLKHGLKVFSAPKSDYTNYVFLKELMKFKGSDASWVGDKELPPEIAAQLSDDEGVLEQEEGEEEHSLQNPRKGQKRKHTSQDRHKQFEKSMNRCNTLNTRVANLVDRHRHMPRPIHYNDHPQRSPMNDFHSMANRVPVPFDPTIPPPGFVDYSYTNMGNYRPPMHWNGLPYETNYPSVPQPNLSSFTQGQNNSANYYTNNAGRNHAASSSTQPY